MFTLCSLILEARENLFRDFRSLFSISFYFFLLCVIKKTNRPNGPCPARTPGPAGFISRGEAQPKPNPSPSPEPPRAQRCRRRLTARHPRFAVASKSVPVFFEKPFGFPSVFRSVFLDFLIDRFFRFIYLASVRSFVRFNERFRQLDPDNERSFVNLFVIFLFLGFIPRFFWSQFLIRS